LLTLNQNSLYGCLILYFAGDNTSFFMRSILYLLAFFVFTNIYSQPDPGKEQIESVDFKMLEANLYIDPIQRQVTGSVDLFFDVLAETDSIYIDARRMDFTNVLLNGKPAVIRNDQSRLWIKASLLPSKETQLRFNYTVSPIQAMYLLTGITTAETECSR